MLVPAVGFKPLEDDAHRVLELPEISRVLAQNGLCALLEASHPLVVTVVCDVGLPPQRGNKGKTNCRSKKGKLTSWKTIE